MSDTAQLLADHQPHLKYDSQEMYFADAAEMFVTSPGMRLRRAGDTTDLKVQGHGLDLAFLSHDPYPGTALAWNKGDAIGCPDRNYAARAAALHMDPNIANVAYGHVVDDRDGATWLQYWYFYFYNDFNLIGGIIRAGLHEGDWEMVQIRLGADGTPDLAFYAQHRNGEQRAWDRVEKLPGTQRPVVYVARGSHASYFAPTRRSGLFDVGTGLDHADGRRASPDRQRLVEVRFGDATRRWIRWPGHWGDTRAGGSPADANSPVSPGAHKQWNDPLAVFDGEPAAVAAVGIVIPGPPEVTVAREADGEATLTWRRGRAAPPEALTITVNSPDESDPPRTFNERVEGNGGEVTLTEIDPAKAYDINVSEVSLGHASPAVRVDLPAATSA